MEDNLGNRWVVCRTCLKTSNSELIPIFGTDNLPEQVSLYGGIELNNNKSLPDKICEKCLLLVKAAHKFRSLCQRAEQQLWSLFETNELGTNSIPETVKAVSPTIVRSAGSSDNEQPCTPQAVCLKPLKIELTAETRPKEEMNLVTEYVLEMVEEEAEVESVIAQHADHLMASNDCEYIDLSDDRMDFLEDASNENSANNDITYYTSTQFEVLKQHEDTLSPNEPMGKFLYDEAELVARSEAAKPLIAAVAAENGIDETVKPVSTKNRGRGKKKLGIAKKVAQKRKTKNTNPDADAEATNALVEQISAKTDVTSNYVCSYCGNVYSEKAKLTLHLKIHTKEKPHECEICHKRFTQTPQLARHMNSHTGSRPFKCKFCDASFADPSTCIKHQRIHTHERPYSCELCGKSFSYSNVLKVHLMTHTGEKPFAFCGKKFAQLHHKKTHERIHT